MVLFGESLVVASQIVDIGSRQLVDDRRKLSMRIDQVLLPDLALGLAVVLQFDAEVFDVEGNRITLNLELKDG